MITNIDRNTVRLLRQEILDALKPLESKHGVSFSGDNARFGSTYVSFKIQAAITSSDGTVASKERTNFKELGSFYGLKPEWLDKDFTYHDRHYTIMGLNSRRSKNPVIVKRDDDKDFVMPADLIVRRMGGTLP
jgi:hypothetical protein